MWKREHSQSYSLQELRPLLYRTIIITKRTSRRSCFCWTHFGACDHRSKCRLPQTKSMWLTFIDSTMHSFTITLACHINSLCWNQGKLPLSSIPKMLDDLRFAKECSFHKWNAQCRIFSDVCLINILAFQEIYQLLLNKFPTHTQRAQILQVPEQVHFQSCKTSFAERGGVLRSARPHFSTQSSETDQWTSTLVLMKFSDFKYTGLLCNRGREIHNPSQTLNAPQVVSGNSIGKIPLHSTPLMWKQKNQLQNLSSRYLSQPAPCFPYQRCVMQRPIWSGLLHYWTSETNLENVQFANLAIPGVISINVATHNAYILDDKPHSLTFLLTLRNYSRSSRSTETRGINFSLLLPRSFSCYRNNKNRLRNNTCNRNSGQNSTNGLRFHQNTRSRTAQKRENLSTKKKQKSIINWSPRATETFLVFVDFHKSAGEQV